MSRRPGTPGRRDEVLQRVLADLSREFGGVVARGSIEAAARRAVEGFGGARVDDFVPILAWRRARRDLLALAYSPGYEPRDGTMDGRR